MATSVSSLTVQLFESRGYLVDKCEHYNSHSRKTHDLFGFGDHVAIKTNSAILIIQTTTTTNAHARKKKIEGIPAAKVWAGPAGVVYVCTWRDLKFSYETTAGKIQYSRMMLPRVERYLAPGWEIEPGWQKYWLSRVLPSLSRAKSEPVFESESE